MSFFNSEIVIPIVEMYLPLAGIRSYNSETVDTFERMGEAAVAVVEDELQGKSFLVGESVTLADYFCAGIITMGFQLFYGKEWRHDHPNVTRWYRGIIELPTYASVTEKLEFLDEPKLTNVAPKKS